MARDSEIDSEVDARFALSLHVFVSRLFGWTLLEGAVRGARCSKRKKRGKKKKRKNSSKFVTVRQNSSPFVKISSKFVKISSKFVKKFVMKSGFTAMNSKIF